MIPEELGSLENLKERNIAHNSLQGKHLILLKKMGFCTGHDPPRGSGQLIFNSHGSGRVNNPLENNLTGRGGSRSTEKQAHGSGRVTAHRNKF